MLIVVAPDSFKSTATAAAAATDIAAGISAAIPAAKVITCPLADGGEGTAETLAHVTLRDHSPVQKITLPTTDAAGRLTEATYYFDPAGNKAYIDIASASGLPQVADRLDPLHHDTYGTGVLIADAESRGAEHIVLGLGGSATVDGGTGILTALVAAAHDDRGYALPRGGAPLVNVAEIDTAQLNIKAGLLRYSLLCDTRITPAQAALVYGPQKGAGRQDIALLTGALLRLCEVTGTDPERMRFGAAGGTAISLAWLSRTLWGDESKLEVLSGAEYIADAQGLPELINQADLVVTGEGRFDEQSLTGKVVGTVAELCTDTPLGIIAGKLASELPADCLGVELPGTRELTEQFYAAGRAIAEQFMAQR